MSCRLAILGLVCLIVGLIGPLLPAKVEAAQSSAAGDDEVRSEVARLLKDLDGDRFEVRQQAAARLEQLVARPELGRLLAGEFQRVLLDPKTSFEVRWYLARWCRRLPEVPPPPAEQVSLEELDRLIAQLDDDCYGARLGAARRLQWLLESPKLICPIMLRLKQRVTDPTVGDQTRRRLEPVWQQARAAWLLPQAIDCHLPAVGDDQIRVWVEDLVRPTSEDASGTGLVHLVAKWELLDLLAEDQYVARVKEILQSRLAGQLDAEAAARLEELLQWTRPAMVAEYWQEHRHLGEQHLIVGLPSMSEGAQRPSYFDRIDDRLAHCASGQNLAPGDYPVAVAIPHPLQPNGFFHLVNLPTPRRRMAYAYYVQLGPARRLTELSRRTLDRLLAEKRSLSYRQVVLLEQLDFKEVSRFAGKYFNLVEDQPLAPSDSEPAESRASRHRMICTLLVADGTREAIPGLLEAIDQGRFLRPDGNLPYRLEWWAALSIALRDPWPEVDSWLARLMARTDLLIEGQADGPELGATAAGVLLERHRQAPWQFGLRAAGESLGKPCPMLGYRFVSAEERKAVQDWWEHEEKRKVEP